MAKINYAYLFLAALIPLVMGFIWYSKALFGTAWMHSAGLTEERLKKGNFPLILLLCYVLSIVLASALMPIVIHQFGVMSVLANGLADPNSAESKDYADFMAKYGSNFRTFKHGAFHGSLISVFFALPLLGINALFERRSIKYVAIHIGYWTLTLALMGGVVCAFI